MSTDPESFLGKVEGGVQTNLLDWLGDVINVAVGLAALVCVAILIYSGYLYITAAGDENKVSTATKSLTYAIVGLVICFIAVILVRFVLSSILGQGE
ncbi:MAG: Mbov_0395 family pilin-like conjugal transfer protein [Candidatus Dojkabacteria bacterium]